MHKHLKITAVAQQQSGFSESFHPGCTHSVLKEKGWEGVQCKHTSKGFRCHCQRHEPEKSQIETPPFDSRFHAIGSRTSELARYPSFVYLRVSTLGSFVCLSARFYVFIYRHKFVWLNAPAPGPANRGVSFIFFCVGCREFVIKIYLLIRKAYDFVGIFVIVVN